MDDIKQRLYDTVDARLAAAPDSSARTELVEELSDNLYRRYLDFTAGGMDPEQAYAQAVEELGDTAELVDYLKGMAPDQPLPQGLSDQLDDLVKDVEEIVRTALHRAKSFAKDVSETVQNSGAFDCWAGKNGNVSVHVVHDADAPDPEETAPDMEDFPAVVEAGPIPGGALRAIDIQNSNGDVSIYITEGPEDDVIIDGDVDELEVRRSEDGVLVIRQGKTAASSFLFRRGLSAADVVLRLPRRRWDFLRIVSADGDVTLDGGDGGEADLVSVKTASGDFHGVMAQCGRLEFKTASGDLSWRGDAGHIQADTVSGDVDAAGSFGWAQLSSVSGDVTLRGSAEQLKVNTISGDVEVETGVSPASMELSTKSGDCEARIPDAPFTLRFGTVSGSFSSDFFVGTLGGRSSMFTYGEGGPTYSLNSISGDLSLRKY